LFVLRDLDAPAATSLLYESRPGLAAAMVRASESARVKQRAFPLCNRRWQVQLQFAAPSLGGGGLLLGGTAVSLLLGAVTAGAITRRELRRRIRTAAQLGQYTLIEKIGQGGMGAVYRAKHALLSRPTAVKLLPSEGGDERSRRFEREAQLTSELTHPNTVVVYDYGRSRDGTLYYVMEYIEGVTLEQLVEQEGAQPPARVVHFLLQICGALQEAHDVGLIHRDVKPANLMLTRRGRVADFIKVLDFGLVKRQLGADGASLSGVQSLIGTPGYLSPETITAPESVDARSDQYALGAVAYFLLTGEQVFTGESVIAVCGAHLNETPRRPSERSGLPIPHALEDIVLKCLGKSPDSRFASMTELEQALRACPDVPAWSSTEGASRMPGRSPVGVEPAGHAREEPHTFEVDPSRFEASR
jgi:serine/threonine protein kinase